jgi:hypothetical protein
MTIAALSAVIARAVREPEFREVLFQDAAAALDGYPLSAAETAMLTGLTAETFRSLAAELDRRAALGVVRGSRSEP